MAVAIRIDIASPRIQTNEALVIESFCTSSLFPFAFSFLSNVGLIAPPFHACPCSLITPGPLLQIYIQNRKLVIIMFQKLNGVQAFNFSTAPAKKMC